MHGRSDKKDCCKQVRRSVDENSTKWKQSYTSKNLAGRWKEKQRGLSEDGKKKRMRGKGEAVMGVEESPRARGQASGQRTTTESAGSAQQSG